MKTTSRSILAVVALGIFAVSSATVQAQYNFVTNNGTITITGYTGPGGGVTIPESINGLPVTIIGASAFASTASLTSVTIPPSVTNIRGSAFALCRSLATVTIPNTVTSIDYQAFFYCTALNKISLPDNLTWLGNSTFENCESLTDITIPNALTRIGFATFRSCGSLTNVLIGYSVTSIEGEAFGYCWNLPIITIPENVTNVSPTAFRFCPSLRAIHVDSLSSAYCSLDGVLFDKTGTTLIRFPDAKAATYTLPETVTRIGDRAFHTCTNLIDVVIGSRLVGIGFAAFYWCENLTSISIPDNVTSSIGDATFGSCYNLTNAVIGDGVSSIGIGAFSDCVNLATVTVGNSVTNIGRNAFYHCYLDALYFRGNAPSLARSIFSADTWATAYYLPGTTGWDTTFGGLPTALWVLPNPLILDFGPSFGVRTNQFGFIISWATNASVVVEASTTLANPDWSPVSTNSLAMGIDLFTDGWSYFSDADWTNYAARFYRVRQW